jgi:hypothetical protein
VTCSCIGVATQVRARPSSRSERDRFPAVHPPGG